MLADRRDQSREEEEGHEPRHHVLQRGDAPVADLDREEPQPEQEEADAGRDPELFGGGHAGIDVRSCQNAAGGQSRMYSVPARQLYSSTSVPTALNTARMPTNSAPLPT